MNSPKTFSFSHSLSEENGTEFQVDEPPSGKEPPKKTKVTDAALAIPGSERTLAFRKLYYPDTC